MAEEILNRIKKDISLLEEYRYVSKMICSEEGESLEIPEGTEFYTKTREIGYKYIGIKSRFDPDLIKIMEELGPEKTKPLYLEEISILPGQKIVILYDGWDGSESYKIQWDL